MSSDPVVVTVGQARGALDELELAARARMGLLPGALQRHSRPAALLVDVAAWKGMLDVAGALLALHYDDGGDCARCVLPPPVWQRERFPCAVSGLVALTVLNAGRFAARHREWE